MDEHAQPDDPGRPDSGAPRIDGEPPAAAGWGVWTRRDLPPAPPAGEVPAAEAGVDERPVDPEPDRPAPPAAGPPRIQFVWGADDTEVVDREASPAEVDDVAFTDDGPDATVVSRRRSIAAVDAAVTTPPAVDVPVPGPSAVDAAVPGPSAVDAAVVRPPDAAATVPPHPPDVPAPTQPAHGADAPGPGRPRD